MNRKLIRYLCCPKCHTSLKEKKDAYYCPVCKKIYPIISGIPIFIDKSSMTHHYRKQITYFENEDVSRLSYRLDPWQRRYVSTFLEAVTLPKQGVIVDNATGSGYMAIELAKLGYTVIATDLTLKELIKLKNHSVHLGLSDRIYPVCASSESLPLKDKLADAMTANAILEHLPREKQAVGEMTRILKQNAPLMLSVPLKLKYVFLPLWVPNLIHDKRIGHLRRYDKSSIMRCFNTFSEVKTWYTGSLAKVFFMVLSLVFKNKTLMEMTETTDRFFEHIPFGANNIVMILRKL